MNFTKITNELYGARRAGYTLDTAAPLNSDPDVLDRLRATRGENYVENLPDSLYDMESDLYLGDDGAYYVVLTACLDDESGHIVSLPAYWQQVKPAYSITVTRTQGECHAYALTIGDETFPAIETAGQSLAPDTTYCFADDNIPECIDYVDPDDFAAELADIRANGVSDDVTLDRIPAEDIREYFAAIIREEFARA